jgi:adenosylcobinamide kinase/adenosylcobinamide-phosphate guanylyltransferase
MSHRLTLILGGARSGKSSYAEKMATDLSASVLYVATSEARDADMVARISKHRRQRPASWRTLEAAAGVGAAILRSAEGVDVVLVDCLTMLASNVIAPLPRPINSEQAESALQVELEALLLAFDDSKAEWIIVSNEVGSGIVPAFPLGRVYRDALGRANQRLAVRAHAVILMIAGLPLTLK